MSDHYSMIHYLYQLFYRKVYFNKEYELIPTPKMYGVIDKFLKLVDKKYKLETVGINFLLIYFLFQFKYWTGVEIEAYEKRIQLEFIIGKKAFARWKERDTNYDWTIYDSVFAKQYNIPLQEIKNFFREETSDFTNKGEERIKQLYYNTEKGFVNCVQFTTLYNYRSKLCIVCKFKDDCKKILKQNYLHIYKSRGYEQKK